MQEGTEGPQVRAGTRRDMTPEATPHGGRKPPKNQEGTTKHPKTHHRSKHRTPCGSHQRTPTGHRKPHGEWRAHLHGENGPHPQR